MDIKTFKPRKLEIPVTEIEQASFCRLDDNLRSKTLEEEFKSGVKWQKVPLRYLKMKPDVIDSEIIKMKSVIGDKLFILGHHYQREEVIKFADTTGDSFKLSVEAAEEKNAEYIVFCGVHFMAETADILTTSDQKVILPNMAAGCSMADMASAEDVDDAWKFVEQNSDDFIPITYMNSTASIKSLCGKNGGLVCTSSNAKAAFEQYLPKGKKIFFFPDQHLGRNTALSLGIKRDEVNVWNPFKENGGLTLDQLNKTKVLVWQGHCSVHTRFTVDQIEEAKLRGANVIVHPECTNDVVSQSDYVGSTEYIIDVVNDADPGTKWGVGTEINLVKRLASQNPDKEIFCLDPIVCPCATMYRIHPAYLLWVLDGIAAGLVINQVEVDFEIKVNSKIALERMLNLPK
ncbi:MAG: quinolinate synthase NadA [Dehalococcoidia bacterium]